MSGHVIPCQVCGRNTFNNQPLCLDCQHELDHGLGAGHCPECGQVRYQDGGPDIDERVRAGMKCGPCAYGG